MGSKCVRIGFFAAMLMVAAGAWKVDAVTFPLVWRWANPLPHGNNIIDIAFGNQFWIQVAERGQMYTSTDLKIWLPVDTGTTHALRAVTFFKDRFVVVGESGTVLSGTSATDLKLIDLGTTDWLEGVAASPQLVAAAGDNGAIYTSPDGISWQRQKSGFTDWLRGLTYGTPSGGGIFVAVGEAGFVATSADGTHWQSQSKFTSADLNSVHWFNGEFWAVGDSGAAFQSTNGTKWLNASSGATNTLNSFSGLDTMRLLDGDSEVRLRTGRSTWSDELNSSKQFPPPNWTYLSSAALTNSFLLCGRTGMMAQGLIGTNGSNVWFPMSDSLWNWLWDIKHFPNLYLAVGERATILSSLDGVIWDDELPPGAATNNVFLGIGGKTNLAVAVGSAGTIITSADTLQSVVVTNSDGTLSTNTVSTLGIYWQPVLPRPATDDLQGVTTFGDLVVVSGGSGVILTSPDGTNWTKRTTPTTAFLSSLESFPGGLVAVGKGGTILTSTNAVNWSSHPFQTTNWIYRVRYLDGKLIAVGENGTILTSTNGTSWTSRTSGTTAWLNDVQFLDNTFFVVGNQGTVLTSADAASWTDRGTITGKSLFAAATSDGMLVTVGVEGVILRSQIVPFDPAVKFVKFPTRADQSSFLFSGHPGQHFTLDRATDFQGWVPGPLLQLDGSGALLFTDPRTNSPTRQFFRTTPQQ